MDSDNRNNQTALDTRAEKRMKFGEAPDQQANLQKASEGENGTNSETALKPTGDGLRSRHETSLLHNLKSKMSKPATLPSRRVEYQPP